MANATVGQAGPLMGAFALASRWEFTGYIASMQLCWLLVNSTAVALKGMPDLEPTAMIVLVAAVVVGYGVSLLVSRHVTRSCAEFVLFVVALLGASAVLLRGVLSLIGR